MKKKAQTKSTQTIKTTRYLPVPLTPKERTKAEKALADASVKLAAAKARLDKLKAELADELRTAAQEVRAQTRALTVGKEARVECEETKDFVNKHLLVVRLDTNETVEDRDLSDWELQYDLAGEDGDKAEDGDSDEVEK